MADVRIPSVTGGQVERYIGGRITCRVQAGQTISGGMLVALTGAPTGNEVIKAGAASTATLGVALFDGNGDLDDQNKITVACAGAWDLVASGAINAGDIVAAAANGQVAVATAASGTAIGLALEDIASGQKGPILLRIGGTI